MKKINLFKSFRLTGTQAGIFKITIAAGGIAIGANWSALFQPYTTVLMVIFIVGSIYLLPIWYKQ